METQAFKMTGLAREKFPQGKVGDTVKVRVPDIDHGSNNRSWYHQRSAKNRNKRWYTKFVVST